MARNCWRRPDVISVSRRSLYGTQCCVTTRAKSGTDTHTHTVPRASTEVSLHFITSLPHSVKQARQDHCFDIRGGLATCHHSINTLGNVRITWKSISRQQTSHVYLRNLEPPKLMEVCYDTKCLFHFCLYLLEMFSASIHLLASNGNFNTFD